MGKKPAFGLAGLILAGATLAGCESSRPIQRAGDDPLNGTASPPAQAKGWSDPRGSAAPTGGSGFAETTNRTPSWGREPVTQTGGQTAGTPPPNPFADDAHLPSAPAGGENTIAPPAPPVQRNAGFGNGTEAPGNFATPNAPPVRPGDAPTVPPPASVNDGRFSGPAPRDPAMTSSPGMGTRAIYSTDTAPVPGPTFDHQPAAPTGGDLKPAMRPANPPSPPASPSGLVVPPLPPELMPVQPPKSTPDAKYAPPPGDQGIVAPKA
jgi:hypothetical protein